MKIELLNTVTEQPVKEITYTLQHPTEGVLIYKEWVNEKDKLIDSTLMSKHGHTINDPSLVEEIWDFIDNLEEK